MRSVTQLVTIEESVYSALQNKQYLLQNFQQFRVIQTNLLFIHGLTQNLAYNISANLQNYGVKSNVIKISTQKIKNNFYSAFVTFAQQYDTAIAMLNLNNREIGKRKIKVYYGSTKFCPEFLLDRNCTIQECNYAHYLNPYLTHQKKDLKNLDHTEIAKSILHMYNPEQQAIILMNQAYIDKQQKTKQIDLMCQQNKNIQQAKGVNRQVEWFDIDSQITQYVRLQPKQQNKKRTNVQMFLDSAENFLLSLIFKHQIHSY